MKNILLLGAGLVANPMIQYLLKQENILLTVADQDKLRVEKLLDNHPKGKAVSFDVKGAELDAYVSKADLVISLLPYTLHPTVAKACLKHNKHFITSSYLSDEMKSFHEEAESKNLFFLNELGMDPGIDHMSAQKIIDEVRAKGGVITSFDSICGGIPAPEANTNPMGYKFSWSPIGVLYAGNSEANYFDNNKHIHIPAKDLFASAKAKQIDGYGDVEVYPNRDSRVYKDYYNIKHAERVFRGTIRNPGWTSTLLALVKLGYLSIKQIPELNELKSAADITAHLINSKADTSLSNKVINILQLPENSTVINNFKWLGIFDSKPLNKRYTRSIDVLADLMTKRMNYEENERDMLILQHEFIASYPDGKKEKIISLLLNYGIPGGDSAMARTVSLPPAIAAKLILNDEIPLRGVQIPIFPEIYKPVLKELETFDIKFIEKREII